MRPGHFAVGIAATLSFALPSERARAEEQPAPTNEQIVSAVNADANPNAKPSQAVSKEEEAPPPLPRKKGIVVESSLGALAFLGHFRQVAPTAPWFHVLAGYELFSWLLLFGEGELAFSDTSVAQDPSKTRAFPIFGFGGGARVTLHFTERVAMYAQGSLGAMKADIANNAFALLGYRNAESLGLSLTGRLGLEWYQLDRHLALGVAVGMRDATGFAKTGPGGDSPLMLDAAGVLRYTF
jgi:hypothetical protein